MITVILVVHLIIAIALVGIILLQRSEGGALGIGGGGGGGMGGFMTGRSTANLLTRVTAGLAIAFILTSLGLARLSGGDRASRSIMESAPPAVEETAPETPQQPAVPLAR